MARTHPQEAAEYLPASMTLACFTNLKSILECLIPQDKECIDIARALETNRAAGTGDGWRYAEMPPDSSALTLGLERIEANSQTQYRASFSSLKPADQHALLKQVQKGEVTWAGLDARRWFEDLLAEATEIYVSHPATLAAMGMSGIAFLPEWPQIGLNTAQAWEPHAKDDRQ